MSEQHNAARVPFFLVDVFADQPLEGNPLAIVADADEIGVEMMRSIAREFNQSETTFLLQPTQKGANWRLRSFTPSGAEVFGAGHNALGAWWWLAASGRLGAVPQRTYHQQIGDQILAVEVSFQREGAIRIAMDHQLPEFGRAYSDLEALAAALGVRRDDLADGPPPQVVSTGAPHLLVPIRTADGLDRLRLDASRLLPILSQVRAQGCYCFFVGPPCSCAVARTRFFNPTVGIWEDPATGSAAVPLACCLRKDGVIREDGEYAIEQGHAMGRPSRITVLVSRHRVAVIGTAALSAEGQLFLGAS